jgi:hypothetical protein
MLQMRQPYAPLRPGTCPTHWVLELPMTGLTILLLTFFIPPSVVLQAWATHGWASWGIGRH